MQHVGQLDHPGTRGNCLCIRLHDDILIVHQVEVDGHHFDAFALLTLHPSGYYARIVPQ
ncbi:hypothetical protein D3C84_742250 [compost metagenome]